MLPQILTPTAFGRPVAALSIDGLAICCFNRASSLWEVAFPRAAGHEFKMLVKQVDRLGRILDETVPIPVPNIQQVEIFVDSDSDAHLKDFPDGFFKAAPHFSRRGDESYDYRWVIDVAGPDMPHGPCLGLNKLPKVTIVTIPHALFYTKRVTPEAVVLAPQTANPDENGVLFGRTNEEIGAAVYTSKTGGELIIRDKITGKSIPELFPMPLNPGLMYEISLLNMEAPGGPKPSLSRHYFPGDFSGVYEIIKISASATKHEIFAPLDSVFRDAEGDCHSQGAGHDGGNISSLMGLIEP